MINLSLLPSCFEDSIDVVGLLLGVCGFDDGLGFGPHVGELSRGITGSQKCSYGEKESRKCLAPSRPIYSKHETLTTKDDTKVCWKTKRKEKKKGCE